MDKFFTAGYNAKANNESAAPGMNTIVCKAFNGRNVADPENKKMIAAFRQGWKQREAEEKGTLKSLVA